MPSARFERATSTFAEWRSYSAELRGLTNRTTHIPRDGFEPPSQGSKPCMLPLHYPGANLKLFAGKESNFQSSRSERDMLPLHHLRSNITKHARRDSNPHPPITAHRVEAGTDTSAKTALYAVHRRKELNLHVSVTLSTGSKPEEIRR